MWGEMSATKDMHMNTTLRIENEEGLKYPLMRVKEDSAKAGIKFILKKPRS